MFHLKLCNRTLICNQSSEINGYHLLKKETYNFHIMDFSFDDFLHDSKNFFNLEKTSFAAVITYQGEDLHVHEQIYYAHVFAAEMIHHISHFFFEENCYTRPMKNFSDAYLKNLLNLCEKDRVIYLLFSGQTPIKNYKYKL